MPHPDAFDPSAESPSLERSPRVVWLRRALLTLLVVAVGFTGLMMQSGKMDLLAQNLMLRLTPPPLPPMPTIQPLRSDEIAPAPVPMTFAGLGLHPDRLYQPYTSGPMPADPADPSLSAVIADFRDLLDLYATRQGVDDNFTIRVLDNRTNTVLEVYSMDDARRRFNRSDSLTWADIDKVRRTETRRLVDKYEALGLPGSAISVRWGRANQVFEARQKETPYIEYEMRLAQYLGLSLLATEIGTVETFNTDQLVSSVGARGRYQIMPYLLRQFKIHHYAVQTATGERVQVFEEWHPLLTMEPAFMLMRGYANAVGHEVPGLSAYHAGPFNIYKIYQLYLAERGASEAPPSNVMEAFMWGLTAGFDKISSTSSFKQNSRGYIPAVYGSLRATDDLPIDTSRTHQVERVQLLPDARILLSDLLAALGDVRWRTGDVRPSAYNQFRQVNPHFALPAAPDSVGVPPAGNVRLVDAVEGTPVRFFLPLGASARLAAAGLSVLDDDALFRYDRQTYAAPSDAEQTAWDRQYAQLVGEIGRFGFTERNRTRLEILGEQFRVLAQATPTHYRQMQRGIIKTHLTLWRSERWETLANTTAAVFGTSPAPVYPPDPLDAATTAPAAEDQ